MLPLVPWLVLLSLVLLVPLLERALAAGLARRTPDMWAFLGKFFAFIFGTLFVVWLLAAYLTCSAMIGTVGQSNADCPFPFTWMAR